MHQPLNYAWADSVSLAAYNSGSTCVKNLLKNHGVSMGQGQLKNAKNRESKKPPQLPFKYHAQYCIGVCKLCFLVLIIIMLC